MPVGLEPAAALRRRITPKPVPCASCRSTIASPIAWRSHAARASSSVAAVATTSTRSGTETSSTRRSAICGESSTTSAFIISSARWLVSYSVGRTRPCGGPPSWGRGICAALVTCRLASANGSCGMTSSGDELILYRVISDVRVRFEIHLLEYPRAVRAHGLDAQEKLLGDLRDALPGGELAEDLELALRELRVRRLVGRGTREPLRGLVCLARTHMSATLRGRDDGRDQVLRGRVLRDEARCARLQQVDGVLVLRVTAHDEHGHLGTNRLAAVQHVHAGHV